MAVHANPPSTGEGALHFFARESQTFLLWSVYILLAVTLGTMILFFPFAIIPAVLLIVAYLLLMVTNVIERRSDHREADAPAGADAGAPGTPQAARAADESRAAVAVADAAEADEVYEYEKPWKMPLLKHETLVVSIAILVVLGLAIAIAAIKFGGMALAVTGFFLFAYIVLLTLPVWMAALEDDIEDEGHRLEHVGEKVGVEGAGE